MLKKKVCGLVLVTCVCGSLLTGCSMPDWMTFPFGKMTVDKLLDKSSAAMSDLDSCSLVMNMDYDVKMSAKESGASVSMDVGIGIDDLTMDVVMDDKKEDVDSAHIYGDIAVNMFGMDVSVPLEMYMNNEDDGCYMYTSSDGSSWEMEKKSDDDSALDSDSIQGIKSVDASAWTLAEKTEKLGDTEVYKMTAVVDGDKLEDIMSLNMEDMFGDMGMTDMELPDLSVTQYIDKKDFYVVKIDIGFADTGDKEIKMSTDDADMTFKKFDIEMVYDKFNAIERDDVIVPDEVKKAATDVTGSDVITDMLEGEGLNIEDEEDWSSDTEPVSNDDNSFTYEGYTVSFNKTKDFDELYLDDNYLGVYGKDGDYSLNAHISSWFDGKDSVIEAQQSANSYYNDKKSSGDMKDITISDVQATTFGKYPVYWFSQQYTDTSSDSEEFAFVYKEYEFYIDLGNEDVCEVSVAEYSDVGSSVTLTDEVALNMLSLFSVKEAK